jgi:hypothetical protein
MAPRSSQRDLLSSSHLWNDRGSIGLGSSAHRTDSPILGSNRGRNDLEHGIYSGGCRRRNSQISVVQHRSRRQPGGCLRSPRRARHADLRPGGNRSGGPYLWLPRWRVGSTSRRDRDHRSCGSAIAKAPAAFRQSSGLWGAPLPL